MAAVTSHVSPEMPPKGKRVNLLQRRLRLCSFAGRGCWPEEQQIVALLNKDTSEVTTNAEPLQLPLSRGPACRVSWPTSSYGQQRHLWASLQLCLASMGTGCCGTTVPTFTLC